MNQFAEFGLSLFEMLSPAILALLGWLGVKLSQWIKAKIGNELLGGMMAKLNDSVFTAVKALEQTAVRQIKAAKDPSSPGGNKITEEEAAQIKKAALDEIKSHWGLKGLKELAGVLGLTEGGLESFLGSKIEAAVHDLKETSASPLPQP